MPLHSVFGFNEKSEKHAMDQDDESLESQELRSFTRNQVLLCATHGKIYAISKKDGSRLWRQDFPTGAFGGIVSIFVTDNDTVLLGANGKTACLDLFTGEEKWVNKMKGFGYEEVAVIASPSRFLLPKAQSHLNDQFGAMAMDPSAPPSYETTTTEVEKQMFYGCSRGKVLALDPENGEEAWQFNCPQGGYSIPSVLIEPPSQDTEWPFQVIYIGCGRWVYCLKAVTGDVLWSLRITNSKLGLGFMTFATPWSSRLAAEAHTSFNTTPAAQCREIQRRHERSSGG